MHNHSSGHTPSAPSQHRPSYPLHKVVAAIEPARQEQIAAALTAAGLASDHIEIVTAADAPVDEQIGGSGIRGFIARLGLSLGADLDAAEQARSELSRGHALILVAVHDDAERVRVHDILREHGGHSMRYFGHWTITTLDGGTH